MSKRINWLTKSTFIHALDCPTKAYYKVNDDQYQSTQDENGFLQALADGGIQVGELARHYFPGGHLIEYNRDKQVSLDETANLLEQDSVILYEAAIAHENCYSLVDVLVKEGNKIKLIEVKSKSWPPKQNEDFQRLDGLIRPKWQKYLYDVAFQTWIAKHVFPDADIQPYLMLINKEQEATVEGLHQYFEIQTVNGRSELRLTVPVEDLELGEPILTQVHVAEQVDLILNGTAREPLSPIESEGFDSWIYQLRTYVGNNEKYPSNLTKTCKNCEHRVAAQDLADNKTCGFDECWGQGMEWTQEQLAQPLVFDVWNEKSIHKMLDQGIYHLDELTPEYYKVDYDTLPDRQKFEQADRKSLQIMKTTGRDPESEIVLPGLFAEMDTWTYPLHFIDFEGVAPAIPFHMGMRPYKKTPFQFSIHDMDEHGNVSHVAEWVERERGKFPCFTFIRELMKVLEKDSGSVFMYHHYERTTLRDVRAMLEQSNEADKDDLIAFIDTLVDDQSPRYLIDQQELIRKYYYSSHMGNSNSIKYVLPAVLTESEYLQEVYTQPYSGLSIQDKVLYAESNGIAVNPYQLLDPLELEEIPEAGDDLEGIVGEDQKETVADGGMAMMAWSRMQFPDVPEEERERVFKSLLRYCELDTLAMAMIQQHWSSIN